ncbi:PspC domain-containing protein [Mucilaginibacter sp. BT774]|uniref:PspC domain-containing protein n=1 Tax=Mucilaginibacter sp. BT774 TaxID=3062276 RepID=UPI0026757823|nr:PspC domain-containing protein [Mucilaginibacter sp. BT774]MDO3628399.1 PspC domain-containing protein [Mucilaginibacter sp. BT774]
MNKTIIININGIVFHIEEDAYEVLKNYMTDVKRHFMNSDDSLEITTDIENRIAEMFNELLANEHKQVIIEQDVKSVIEQMGTVEDFEHAEEDTKASFTNAYYHTGATRRLFRDQDDHLIAGVCSGIANYFDMDVVWIRLAFALIVLAGGTGIILYIILWIVIPKAVTRADRMVMKGEKLNLQGFKKNFEEEMGSMRDNFSNLKHEAKPFVYKTRDFIGDFFYHLGTFFNGAGKILLKLIGLFILLSCFAGLIFFIVAFVALLGFGQFAPFHDMPYGLLRHHHPEYIYTAGFIVITVPLVSIILLTLKGIFNTGSISRSAGTTILVIWLFAIAVFVYDVTRIAADFSSSASYSETINLKAAKNNTYYLKLNDLKYFTAEDSARLNIKNLAPNMKITDDEDNDFDHYRQRVRLSIEKSDVDQPVLIESYHARGKSYDDALTNSRNIKYIYTQQDSLLKFDERFYPKNDELWHDEEVYLTLKLPMNAKIIIERELDRISDIRVYDCNELNKRDGNKLSDAIFIMTDNGLQCKVDTMVTDTVLNKHLLSDSAKKLKK